MRKTGELISICLRMAMCKRKNVGTVEWANSPGFVSKRVADERLLMCSR